jgi:4-hydroxy-4-methyl-2-oxoglutarate aldolase
VNVATDLETTFEELATRLYTAVVSDALDVAGSTGQVLAPRIRPVGPLRRPLIGRAATARAVRVDAAPERPYSTLLESMDRLAPGQVWIVATDGDGEVRSAIFGGLLATAARARGAIGCIVDGAVRDSRELERLEFPTFATGFCPADSFGRDEVVEHGRPIRCGGVEIQPGDLVVADHDGAVVVPSQLESEVIERALAKVEGERDMRDELAAGLPAGEAFAKYGIL